MRRYFYSILQSFFSDILFFQNSDAYYLTIDDSPSENTHAILKILEDYDQKATFFCIGKNIEKYPENFQAILNHGHRIGYHSYAHESNWRISYKNILADYDQVSKIFKSTIYRPPYGKLSLRFLFYLKRRGIKTILWTFLMVDWKELQDPIGSMQRKLAKAPLGSIFVFHDNDKSVNNIKIMLPYFIQNAVNKGIALSLIE